MPALQIQMILQNGEPLFSERLNCGIKIVSRNDQNLNPKDAPNIVPNCENCEPL